MSVRVRMFLFKENYVYLLADADFSALRVSTFAYAQGI